MDNSTVTKKTIKGLFWVFSGTGGQQVVQIFILGVLARLLSAQDFGLVNAAQIVIGFSSLFSHLGIGPAIVQRKVLTEQHITTGYTVSLITGVSFTLLNCFFAPVIASIMNMSELTEIIRVISLLFIVQSFNIIPHSLLARNLRFKQQTIIQLISYVFGYGLVGIVMALLDMGVWALVWAQISQAIIGTVCATIFQPYPKKITINKLALNDLFYFGGGFTIARVANYLANSGDNFVVGRWLGKEALGNYSRAFQIVLMPSTLFGSVLDSVLFPAMSTMQENNVSLKNAFRRGVLFIAVIIFPISILSVILAPEIIRIFLGENWSDVILPFQILALGMLFRTSNKMSDSLARAKGAVYNRAWRQALFAIAVFVGAWVGSYGGLPGVAFGVLLANLLNYCLMAQLSLKILSMSWKEFFKAQISSLWFAMFSFVLVGSLVFFLRIASISAVIIVLFSVLLFGLLILLVLWLKPSLLLGSDGIWMLDIFKNNFSTYFPLPLQRLISTAIENYR